MSARKIKKEVIAILEEPELHTIYERLQGFKDRDLVNPLFSSICRGEEVLRWHAVSVFGKIVARIAKRDLEASRVIMRRFLWSLNDESGGIGWGAPEAMAEIMLHTPTLFDEYHHMLLSYMREDGPQLFQDGNYLELPQLQAGLLWAIGRLTVLYKKVLLEEGAVADVLSYLSSPEKNVRGMAVWCVASLDPKAARGHLEKLTEDDGKINHYLNGRFVKTSVCCLAKEALQSI